jgi:hypothetical protein
MAKTDEELKTIHSRLTCWIKAEPRQWKDLEAFLGAMGYQMKIFKKAE